MTMSAFKQFSTKDGRVMTDISLDSDRPFVEVAHYEETRKGRKTDRPRRLALRRRDNGSHYFTWKTQAGSERINTQDFVVAF